jgi:MoxR-like ATPase
MQESQVTVDGTSRRLDEPFFVVATQNTIEQRGTFPLPEAQLDRFAVSLRLGYPSRDQEVQILEEQQRSEPLDAIAVVADVDRLNAAREAVRHVFVEASLRGYMVDLVAATRGHADVLLGASPRASLTLMRCSQAMAVLESDSFVTPQHIQSVAEAVLAHRLVLRPKPRLAGARAAGVVRHVLERVAVPVE